MTAGLGQARIVDILCRRKADRHARSGTAKLGWICWIKPAARCHSGSEACQIFNSAQFDRQPRIIGNTLRFGSASASETTTSAVHLLTPVHPAVFLGE